MRWPWSCEGSPPEVEHAREAADLAERKRDAIHARGPEAFALAAKGREQRARNHFGESIDLAMKRRHA